MFVCVCTRYLGDCVKVILNSPQHATGPQHCRKLQLPVQIEQSGELGHACDGASRREDLCKHSGGAAALDVMQWMDEETLLGARTQE